MAIQFTITDTRNPDEHFTRAFVQNKVTIGRARHCDICLPDLSVSTSHAEIRFHNNDYCLMDNGSLNGTWCNERKLVAHRPKPLCSGDRFQVSSFEIVFQLNAPHGTATERHLGQKQALKMLSAVLAMRPSEPPPEPDLKQIQNAPEDETESFCTDFTKTNETVGGQSGTPEPEMSAPSVEHQLNTAETSGIGLSSTTTDDSENAKGNAELLPTGPEDPLAPPETAEEIHTQDTPPSPGRKKSDLGLILVGGIVVVSCVVALIRLLA